MTFAPLVRNSDKSPSSSTLFRTTLLTNSAEDLPIIDFLKNVTNLLVNNDKPPIPGLSPNCLRDYQWEGTHYNLLIHTITYYYMIRCELAYAASKIRIGWNLS